MGDINLRLHHTRHFDLLPPPEGETYTIDPDDPDPDLLVSHPNSGPHAGQPLVYRRHHYDADGGYTDFELPSDYDVNNPSQLADSVKALTSRSAPLEAIYAVSGDDVRMVRRFAALLDAVPVEHHFTSEELDAARLGGDPPPEVLAAAFAAYQAERSSV